MSMLNSANTANGIAKPQLRRAVRVVAMIVASETNGAPKTNRVITGTGGPIRGQSSYAQRSVPIAAAKPNSSTNNAPGTVRTARIQFTTKRTRCSDRLVISRSGCRGRGVGFAHPAVRCRCQDRPRLGAEMKLCPRTGNGEVLVARLVDEHAHGGGPESRGAVFHDLHCLRPDVVRDGSVEYQSVVHLHRAGPREVTAAAVPAVFVNLPGHARHQRNDLGGHLIRRRCILRTRSFETRFGTQPVLEFRDTLRTRIALRSRICCATTEN